MSEIYFFAARTDSGCLCGCDHKHQTIISAVACISSAGGYVVAVEDEELRELTAKEVREFQFAMYGTKIARSRLRAIKPLCLPKPILN